MKESALWLGLLCLVGGTSAFAQDGCYPSARCAAAGQSLESYLGSLGSGGMAASAAGAYCSRMVQAEVTRICADEWMAQGLSDCADLAYQQMDQLLAEAAQSRDIFEQVGSGSVEAACGW